MLKNLERKHKDAAHMLTKNIVVTCIVLVCFSFYSCVNVCSRLAPFPTRSFADILFCIHAIVSEYNKLAQSKREL